MNNDINEIFALTEESPRYSDTALEIHDKLANLIQKIEVMLYTEKGSLLCQPDFGVDIEKYVFETNVNAEYLRNEIMMQIQRYIISTEDCTYNVNCDVNFFDSTNSYSFTCVIDIFIDGRVINSYAL